MDICNPIVRPIERIVLILMLRAIPPASEYIEPQNSGLRRFSPRIFVSFLPPLVHDFFWRGKWIRKGLLTAQPPSIRETVLPYKLPLDGIRFSISFRMLVARAMRLYLARKSAFACRPI